MLTFVLGQIASLFPSRYRRWIQIAPSSAVVSGVLQFLTFLSLFIYRYLVFARSEVFGGVKAGLTAMERGGETALAGSGIFVLMEYMIQPLTFVLVYFTFEGLVRGVAAFVGSEIVPSLPLALMAWAHRKLDDFRAEKALGPRVPDEVEAIESDDVQLRIRSCRAKSTWDDRLTIFYLDGLYEVAGEERADPPRRFVYLLRLKPANKLVRGTYHYDPSEVLSQG